MTFSGIPVFYKDTQIHFRNHYRHNLGNGHAIQKMASPV